MQQHKLCIHIKIIVFIQGINVLIFSDSFFLISAAPYSSFLLN